jgi:shikimate dehydrogenase
MVLKAAYHLGLTGYPLGHSLSPLIHRAAMQSLGLEGDYKLYPIPTDSDRKKRFKLLIDMLRSGQLHGLNVTIPYKIEILELIDRLSPAAEAIGAVNTVFYRDKQIIGDNTDAAGFLADLSTLYPQLAACGGRKNVLVLGSGGAARAVVFALKKMRWQVTVASRSTSRGKLVADRFNRFGKPDPVNVIELTPAFLSAFLQTTAVSLIVNATPVGMAPEIGGSPWPESVLLPEKTVVYDLIYSPAETCFVKTAHLAGREAFTGLGMLVEQAACAFEIWTGLKPSREYVFNELRKEAVLR